MSLSEALSGVSGYRPDAGRAQPAQQHLSTARTLVANELPPLGYKVRSSGSGQTLPKVPWIAVLDPDVTTTAQKDLYVVYLFDVGTEHVYLSMNQGATAHLEHHRQHRTPGIRTENAALAEIVKETIAIREWLDSSLLDGTTHEIFLGSDRFLPRAYEAGNIAAIPYDLASLPPEAELMDDLQRFLALYRETVPARAAVVASNPAEFNVPAPTPRDDKEGAVFQPKSAEDYLAWVSAHHQRRTRKHEALVKSFGELAQSHGWKARTKGVHPRDLVLDRGDEHLLVEAKTVRANSELAVREAIGQLLAYEFVCYPAPTTKVALFSAPIAPLWVDLLNRLSIASVWPDGPNWWAVGEPVAWITESLPRYGVGGSGAQDESGTPS